jgi:hypothetical protein
MTKLTDRIDVSTPEVYYDPKFRLLIEQHLSSLINYRGNVYLTLTPMEAEVWQGNLYGYLFSQGVPIHQHWIIMRMNGMDSTLDFSNELETLILPDMEQINRLRELFNTVHRIQ